MIKTSVVMEKLTTNPLGERPREPHKLKIKKNYRRVTQRYRDAEVTEIIER
jgi:hypothetical protein